MQKPPKAKYSIVLSAVVSFDKNAKEESDKVRVYVASSAADGEKITDHPIELLNELYEMHKPLGYALKEFIYYFDEYKQEDKAILVAQSVLEAREDKPNKWILEQKDFLVEGSNRNFEIYFRALVAYYLAYGLNEFLSEIEKAKQELIEEK